MPHSNTKTIGERIIQAGIVVAAAHLFLKLTGLIQAKAAATYLSSQEYEVIFAAAFTNGILSLFLIGEEIIGPSFLPVFMRQMDEEGEKEGWHFANAVLTLQAILLLVVVTVVMCFPDLMARLLTAWTPEDNPERYGMLRTSLVVLAPCLIFLSLGSTTYMLLNGYRKFFLAAFGDASWKICVVIALVVGIGIFHWDARALIFGLLIGSAAKLGTHLIGLLPKLRFVRPSLHWRSPAMKTFALLMLPLIAGILFAKFRDIFNNVRILTHIRDQPGIVQSNDLGRKLFASISWLVPYALQIALFPFLCELVDRNDRQELGRILTQSCRLLLAVFIPGTILLAVLAEPISVVLFLGGETGLQVALWTGVSMACYLLVLPPAAVECVLMQGYFADRRMTSVTLIGIGASLISVVISYIGIVHFKAQAVGALAVVALGFGLSRWLKSGILIVVLKRSVPMFPARQSLLFFLRLVLLGAIVGVVAWGINGALDLAWPDGLEQARRQLAGADPETVIGPAGRFSENINRVSLLIKMVISTAAGGAAFLLGAVLLRIREPLDMMQWLLRRVGLMPALETREHHDSDTPKP